MENDQAHVFELFSQEWLISLEKGEISREVVLFKLQERLQEILKKDPSITAKLVTRIISGQIATRVHLAISEGHPSTPEDLQATIKSVGKSDLVQMALDKDHQLTKAISKFPDLWDRNLYSNSEIFYTSIASVVSILGLAGIAFPLNTEGDQNNYLPKLLLLVSVCIILSGSKIHAHKFGNSMGYEGFINTLKDNINLDALHLYPSLEKIASGSKQLDNVSLPPDDFNEFVQQSVAILRQLECHLANLEIDRSARLQSPFRGTVGHIPPTNNLVLANNCLNLGLEILTENEKALKEASKEKR